MGFVISHSGDTEQVLTYLRGLTPEDLANDRAGMVLRNVAVQAISECSAELEPHQVYNVKISGDSSTLRGFKLEATIGLGDRFDYVEPVEAPR